jgi:sec-independent protein translocase protein TatC
VVDDKDKKPEEPVKPASETADEDDDEESHPGEKRMPFLDHLEELRWCLLKAISAVILCSIGAWFYREEIIYLLVRLNPDPDAKLIYLKPIDAMMVQLQISLALGTVIALPIVIQQAWSFIAPGLLPHEKKYVPYLIFFTILCFAIGAAFAYFIIIPFTLKFLASFSGEHLQASWTIDYYLAFVTQMILGFGLVFEMPMLALALAWIGIIDDHFLKKYRSYGIVAIFVIAALLTPPEPSSQIMLAIPLVILYEISILVTKVVRKRKERRAADDEDQD